MQTWTSASYKIIASNSSQHSPVALIHSKHGVIEIQKGLPTVWIFCIKIRLSQLPPLMCKCLWFWSMPKLPTITMKIAAVEFWWLMCFYFRLPRSAKSLWAVTSWERRNNENLCVSEANLGLAEGDAFSSVDSIHSVQSTICRCVAQRHRRVNKPVFTVSTEAINLGWILRDASISQMNEAQSSFCRAVDSRSNFLFG